jgi:anti-sigma regulatory factor (Ser/Thr protein kinase)
VVRHWAAELALGAGCDVETARTLALVVTELASNAVKHAASEFTVELDLAIAADGSSTVRIGVSDGDSRLPRMDDVDSGALGGRGLALVQSLSDSFGVEPYPAGKTVWACLSSRVQVLDAAQPAKPATAAGTAVPAANDVVAVLESAAEVVRTAEALAADAAGDQRPAETPGADAP